MNTTPDCVGDIYVVVAQSRDHPVSKPLKLDGLVFACRKQRCSFPDGLPSAEPVSGYGLARQNLGSKTYYDIVPTFSEVRRATAATTNHSVQGVFIPRGVNKKIVADSLRERFGAGSVLLKPEPEEHHN